MSFGLHDVWFFELTDNQVIGSTLLSLPSLLLAAPYTDAYGVAKEWVRERLRGKATLPSTESVPVHAPTAKGKAREAAVSVAWWVVVGWAFLLGGATVGVILGLLWLIRQVYRFFTYAEPEPPAAAPKLISEAVEVPPADPTEKVVLNGQGMPSSADVPPSSTQGSAPPSST